jgi:hypothetical protein
MEQSALLPKALKNKIYSPCLCYEGTIPCSVIFNKSCCFGEDNGGAVSVWLILCPVACICCLSNCLSILHDTSDCLCLPCCCYLKISDTEKTDLENSTILQKVTYTYCLFGKTTELVGPSKQFMVPVNGTEKSNLSVSRYVSVE